MSSVGKGADNGASNGHEGAIRDGGQGLECVHSLGHRLSSLTYQYSPRVNSNLLPRSEIVALFNTFHCFSEGLEFVNDFRGLWSGTS
jgi:hypothetical protein